MSEAPLFANFQAAARRELRKPYFLLRTPDGLSDYFTPQIYRVVKSRREPISRFLANARLAPAGDDGPAAVEYDVEEFAALDPSPLEYLTQAEVEAFAAAVEAFLRPEKEGRRVTPHEQNLRARLRLPDPDLEPDAYWVYGPPESRALLILWGVEAEAGSSLPLISETGDADSIVGRLRARVMDWAARQKEMRRLLERRSDPLLAPYVAVGERGPSGQIEAWRVAGQSVSVKKMGSPKRFLGKGLKGFAAASAAFYAAARPAASTSSVEKELRCAFQIPDPVRRPDLWRKIEGRPVVRLDEIPRREEAIYLCADAEIPLPPTSPGNVPPPTAVDRLTSLAAPVFLYAGAAAATLVVFIAAALLLEVFADRSPLRLESVIALDDPQQITAVFSKPVLAASLHAGSVEGVPTFRIRAESGRPIEIHEIRRSTEDPARVYLQTDPLQDGAAYTLGVAHLLDDTRKRNALIPDARADFTFLDTVPPAVLEVSAEGSDDQKLLVRFSKPLDSVTAAQRINYRIPGFRILNVELLDDEETVVLTAERSDRAAEPRGFIHEGIYDLTIQGVADATVSRNVLPAPVELREFRYVDTIPPRLVTIFADRNQMELLLVYNEPLDPASAQTPAHFRLYGESDRPLPRVRRAVLRDDERSVLLTLDPVMFNGIEYTLTTPGVADRARPRPNAKDGAREHAFFFVGLEDTEPPALREARVTPDRREIIVTFSEPVREDSFANPAIWSVDDGGEVVVERAAALGADGRQVALELNRSLAAARTYELVGEGLTDAVGNIADRATIPVTAPGLTSFGEDLALIEATALSSTRIRLVFNEDLVGETARALENYRTDPPHRIARVLFENSAGTDVVLQLDPETPLQSGPVTVTARNLRLRAVDFEVQRPVHDTFQVDFGVPMEASEP
ncbi:MAG: Ig-like domain-containing protein [Opitutales bacterium]|nr:Ig-like domain-containing protein [Opitutales bacterium]